MAKRKTTRRTARSKKSNKSKKVQFAGKMRRATIIIFALVFANIGALTLIFTGASAEYEGHTWKGETDQAYRLNAHRAARGKKGLHFSKCLTEAARDWSKIMGDSNNLRHSNLVPLVANRCGGELPGAYGENVGRTYLAVTSTGVDTVSSSADVFQRFIDSPGHRENIENGNYDFMGIGMYVKYDAKYKHHQLWTTQIFLDCWGSCSRRALTDAAQPYKPAEPKLLTKSTPDTVPDSRNENDQISSTHGDFNGDGFDDIFWYGPGSASDSIWYGTSHKPDFIIHNDISVSGSNYIPVVGDFNGDNKSDIFWYGPGGTSDSMWYGTGTRGLFIQNGNVSVNGSSFRPVAGDFNGDGRDDIFFYEPGSGGDYIWYFNSSQASYSSKAVSVRGTYQPIPGDFNGDGRGDVFWYAPGATTDYVWYFNSQQGSYSSKAKKVGGANYAPVPGDFNGDGRDDVFFYAPGSEADYVWYGRSSLGAFKSVAKSIGGVYNGVPGDFNGDGRGDIFWYGPTGADYIWYGNTTEGSFTSESNVNVTGSSYIPTP